MIQIPQDGPPIGKASERVGQGKRSQFSVSGLKLTHQKLALKGVSQKPRQQPQQWLDTG